jgi:hypothetical protein
MPPAPPRAPVSPNRSRWQAVCKACGRTFPVPEAESDDLLNLGWPACCDRDMTVLYHPNGVPPGDPPLPSGE